MRKYSTVRASAKIGRDDADLAAEVDEVARIESLGSITVELMLVNTLLLAQRTS